MTTDTLENMPRTSKLYNAMYGSQYKARRAFEIEKARKEALQALKDSLKFALHSYHDPKDLTNINMRKALKARSDDFKVALIKYFEEFPFIADDELGFVIPQMMFTIFFKLDKFGNPSLDDPLNETELANVGLLFTTFKTHFNLAVSMKDLVRQHLEDEFIGVPQEQRNALYQAVANAESTTGGKKRTLRKKKSIRKRPLVNKSKTKSRSKRKRTSHKQRRSRH